MGSEAALEFDAMVHAYYSLAYKYGLWNAASIMCNGCTDDGFWDFLGWLIAQGREVYMAALDDPDSLAELPVCKNYWFPDIAYVGDTVYHRITGKDNGGYPDRETFDALKEELKKDIIYGDGVGYPHTWSEAAVYLPRLVRQIYATRGAGVAYRKPQRHLESHQRGDSDGEGHRKERSENLRA